MAVRFTIVPSPIPEVVLTQFDGALFPKFKPLFMPYDEASPLRHLRHNPDDAGTAIVLENTSPKEITALRYRWQSFDSQGKVQNNAPSYDSYLVKYRPVVVPGSRLLITQSKHTEEDILDHVLAGGGCIMASIKSRSSAIEAEVVELKFEIDLVLFADGEIAGPDPEKYVLELNCRKQAAGFVAAQIRRAVAEDRDPSPVLSALAELPILLHREDIGRNTRRNSLNYWIQHFASFYLKRKQRNSAMATGHEAGLKYLENCQALPKFYRRAQSQNS
jgi:hypothetical protein